MPRSDVVVFDVDEGDDAQVTLSGAQALGAASAVSVTEPSNDAEVILAGSQARGIAGAVSVSTGGADVFNPGFPRVAAPRIGERSYGDNFQGTGINFEADPDEVAAMSLCHFSVINPQQQRGQGFVAAAADWVTRSQSANSDHIRYLYTDVQEAGFGTGSVQSDKLDDETGPTGNGGTWLPNDWWVHDESGNYVSTFPGSTSTNITKFVTPDSNGQIYSDFYADLKKGVDLDAHNNDGASKDANGILPYNVYNDVTDHRPLTSNTDYNRNNVEDRGRADWNNDGTEGKTIATAYREGHRIYFDRVRSNSPGILMIGNLTTWSTEYSSPNPDDAPPIHTFYQGMANGGWQETQTRDLNPISGVNASGQVAGVFGSWRIMQNAYLYLMRHTLGPKHILNQFDYYFGRSLNPTVGAVGSNIMAGVRWAICSTLMDDGYVAISDASSQFNTTPHFDETGLINTSFTGLSKGWLGLSVDSSQKDLEDATKQSSVWLGSDLNGIFKREYDNGIVLVNSTKSNTGSITIPVTVGADEANGELEQGKWRRINGFQDSSHNNGQIVNSALTINSIDGYVLEKV